MAVVDPSNVYIGPGYTLSISSAPEEVVYIEYAPTSILKRTLEIDESTYRYTNTDGSEYDEQVLDEDIKSVLPVTDNTIGLPDNFQQIIRVTGLARDSLYKFSERGFGDNEILTNINAPSVRSGSTQHDLFFVSMEEGTINIKSSLLDGSASLDMEINYYAHLPQYNIEIDLQYFDQLTIPLEPTYHNLINYYCIYKYYESWQNKDLANDYFTKYLKLREEYRESVDRKHQENLGTEAVVSVRFV